MLDSIDKWWIKGTDVKRAKLGIGVLVVYSPFEGAHGLFRIYGFGSDDI